MRFGTKAIHAGQEPEPITGAVMTPVFLTSTYAQEYPAEPKDGHDYTRAKNPTRTALEENLAALEGGKTGHAFSSGLAAVSAVLQLLQAGDHVVAGNDLYGGTRRLFEQVFTRAGLQFTFVDPGQPDNVREAIRDNTRLIWIETPTNPLLTVVDLEAVAAIGKDRGLLLACDNTFATPFLQSPLEHGFDIVAHSLTKYLGGHSDLLGGALIVNDPELSERLTFLQLAVGALPGPLDCFLTMRGTKTLHLRMERHCENARAIVDFLGKHPRVEKIYYPGLEQHPNHAVAARQMRDFGGMVSFVLDTSVEETMRIVTRTKVFTLAESLGGVESLIEHPPSMTHASVAAEERRKIGIDDGLIRLSVGVEDIEDLTEDLAQALPRVTENMPQLSIIIPAYNETGGIRPTLDQLQQLVTDLDAEIIVIDDGSTDDTARQAEESGVAVIRHDRNRGYGAALKTGIRHASSDVICITDADGTYPNDRIADLMREIGAYDMVVGARTGSNVAIPLVRRPAKKILNVLANLLTGEKIPDLNSGLRIFKRSIAEKYMHFLPSGFSFTTTITLAMLNDDYLVKFVPIDYYHRAGKSKIRGVRDTYNFIMLILRVTMYFNPLKIFLPVSVMLFLAAAATFVADLSSTTGLSDKTVILSLATGLVFLVGLLADAVANR